MVSRLAGMIYSFKLHANYKMPWIKKKIIIILRVASIACALLLSCDTDKLPAAYVKYITLECANSLSLLMQGRHEKYNTRVC